MKKTVFACLCALLLLAPRAYGLGYDREPEPLLTVEGRLTGQDFAPEQGNSIAFGKQYPLLDSAFSGLLTINKVSDSEFEAQGSASLNESGEVVRWSSRRVFLLLYQDAALVAKIYLPTSETPQHDLTFKKRFSQDKPFNRFEVTVIGAVRLK